MNNTPRFQTVYDRAIKRKGGVNELTKLLPKIKTPKQLSAIGDDRYLAEMTKCIFRSGFVWKVIENKWPGFEKAFYGFNPDGMAALSDEAIEELATNREIVRNYKKILTVRENAWFINDIRTEHGSFARFIADWPVTDLVGLWEIMKKRGSRLGGNTGPMFLRFMGKDTFILTQDVIACMANHKVIDNHKATSKRDRKSIQAVFNDWHEQTGMPMAHLSRMAAYSIG